MLFAVMFVEFFVKQMIFSEICREVFHVVTQFYKVSFSVVDILKPRNKTNLINLQFS